MTKLGPLTIDVPQITVRVMTEDELRDLARFPMNRWWFWLLQLAAIGGGIAAGEIISRLA